LELNVESSGITSLAGIQHFTALTLLDCSDNLLTALDLSGLSQNISHLDNMRHTSDVLGWQMGWHENPAFTFYPQNNFARGTYIITQPAATTTVTQGAITETLSFTYIIFPEISPPTTITFQWFQNNTPSNTGGTAVSGAVTRSLTIPEDLAPGTYYYYCVISVDGAATQITNAATVTVNPPNVFFIDNAGYPTLAAALAAAVTGNTIEVAANAVIPAGETHTVPASVNITIGANMSLTNNGTLNFTGTNATLTVSAGGEFRNTGTFDFASGARLLNSGTVTLNNQERHPSKLHGDVADVHQRQGRPFKHRRRVFHAQQQRHRDGRFGGDAYLLRQRHRTYQQRERGFHQRRHGYVQQPHHGDK
jgi:hypothetical protein